MCEVKCKFFSKKICRLCMSVITGKYQFSLQSPKISKYKYSSSDIPDSPIRNSNSESVINLEKSSDKLERKKSTLCELCSEKPKDCSLIPCGHQELCAYCSKFIKFCPFCRKEVKASLPMPK